MVLPAQPISRTSGLFCEKWMGETEHLIPPRLRILLRFSLLIFCFVLFCVVPSFQKLIDTFVTRPLLGPRVYRIPFLLGFPSPFLQIKCDRGETPQRHPSTSEASPLCCVVLMEAVPFLMRVTGKGHSTHVLTALQTRGRTSDVNCAEVH